jgi:phosphatidate cytidylyltransferase
MQSGSVVTGEFLHRLLKGRMLRQRVLIAILFLPLLLLVIVIGKWLFTLVVAVALGIAAVEFGGMYRSSGFRPALPLLLLSVVSFAVVRYLFGFEFTPILLAALCLIAMTWHVIDYERGAANSGIDLTLTLGGSIYLGWIGAYLVSLRSLPDGMWWVLLVLPVIWAADIAAYFVGRAVGRHPFSPRLSPKKTWEGYLAGILAAVLVGAALGVLWQFAAGAASSLGWLQGAIVGFVVGALSPMGDLGISMFKREREVKDTGSLLPGHGGLLDRIDTWLWSGVLSYYLIVLLTR